MSYTPLGPVYPETSTGRRLALARAITRRGNPLAARVAVNHIWMRHFGTPLVPTVFDFGRNGRPPGHPALLDWLAVEFMDQGWGMKALHRLIVTSRAYRMESTSAGSSDPNLALDPDNSSLWRMNPRAWKPRPSATTCCTWPATSTPRGRPRPRPRLGHVVPAAEPLFPPRQGEARHVPEVVRLGERQLVLPPHRERDASAGPRAGEQPADVRAGAPAGRQAHPRGGESDPAFLAVAFETVLGRPPTGEESEACSQYLAEQPRRLADRAHLTPFNSGPPGAVKPSGDPRQRAREDLIHVLFNHNDFLTIR